MRIGFGIGATYMVIEGTENSGHLFSPGVPFYYKYYLTKDFISFLLGGSVRINAGTETTKGWEGEKSEFFFGPTFEEIIGFSINRTFYLEAGAYQIFFGGSTILPSDFGVRFSLNFLF